MRIPDGESVVLYADMNTFDHPHIRFSDLRPAYPDLGELETINNYIVLEDRESLRSHRG